MSRVDRRMAAPGRAQAVQLSEIGVSGSQLTVIHEDGAEAGDDTGSEECGASTSSSTGSSGGDDRARARRQHGGACAGHPYLAAGTTYLFYYGGLSFLNPFLPVFYSSALHLEGGAIGLLRALPPLCSMAITPALSALADRFGAHRLLLLASIVCPALMYGVFSLDAVQVAPFSVPFLVALCSAVMAAPGNSTLDSVVLALVRAESIAKLEAAEKSDAAAAGRLEVSDGSDSEAADASTDTANDSTEGGPRKGNVADYGKLRLWGAVGWGSLAPVAGLLIQNFGIDVMFAAHICMMLVCAMVSTQLPFQLETVSSRKEFRAGLRSLLTPSFVLFLLVVWIMGTCAGFIGSFLFVYLRDLGGSELLMGLSLTFTCLSEVPVFAVMGRVIGHVGELPVLVIALLAYLIRVIYYSELQDPWLVLLCEPLHGITFGAAVRYGQLSMCPLSPLTSPPSPLFCSMCMAVGKLHVVCVVQRPQGHDGDHAGHSERGALGPRQRGRCRARRHSMAALRCARHVQNIRVPRHRGHRARGGCDLAAATPR